MRSHYSDYHPDNDIITRTCNLTLHSLSIVLQSMETIERPLGCFITIFCLVIACCENLIYHGNHFFLCVETKLMLQNIMSCTPLPGWLSLSFKNCGQNSLIFIGFEESKNEDVTHRSRCTPNLHWVNRPTEVSKLPVSECNAVFSSLVRYQLELFLNMRSFITDCFIFQSSHVLPSSVICNYDMIESLYFG